MAIYNVPKPDFSGWKLLKSFAVRAIFPPILLWDLLKFGANMLLGETVSHLVLPAQTENFDYLKIIDDNTIDDDNNTIDDNDDDTIDIEYRPIHRLIDYNTDSLVCEKHMVITHDGAKLDTFEIKPRNQVNLPAATQKYIINFVGNQMCYEQIIDTMRDDADSLKMNVVGFNLRGVGQSTGKVQSKNDLVTDGIAQVQRLLSDGVSPQNITLNGHSLGGALATLVAKHFHQLGQPINLFNQRSFSTITNFLVGHIRLPNQAGVWLSRKKESIGWIILGWLAKPFIKFGVSLVKWEIDAGTAFKKIPEAYKDYIVVRPSKENDRMKIEDKIITHYASIHKLLTPERRIKKQSIEKGIQAIDQVIQQNDLLIKPQLTEARTQLVAARKKVSGDRKMTLAPSSYPDSHIANLSELENREGKKADSFFTEFVQRTQKDHGVNHPEPEETHGIV